MDAVVTVKQSGAEMHRTIQEIERDAVEAQRRVEELRNEVSALTAARDRFAQTAGQKSTSRTPTADTGIAAALSQRSTDFEAALRRKQWLDAELAQRRQVQPEVAPPRRGISGAIRTGFEEAYVESVGEYIRQTASTEPRGRLDRFRRRVVDRWLTDQGIDVEHFRGLARAEQGQMTDEATRSIDRHTQAVDRSRLATTAMGWSEQRLRAEWRQSSHELAGLTRQIGQLDREHGRAVLDETRQQVEAAREPLRADRARVEAHREMLGDEIRRRGGTIVGNQVLFEHQAGGRLLQQAAGAFMGGMGIGSGSIGGTLAGAAPGTINPLTAIAGVFTLMAGRGVELLKEAYTTQMQMVQRSLPVAQATGTSAYSLIEAARAHSERYRVFDVPDLLQATTSLGRATGRTELTSILPVAALTGQTASEEAGRIGALSRFGATYNPYLSGDLLRAYGASALARPRIGIPPRLPAGVHGPEQPAQLPFEALLYPEFAQGVGRLAQGFSSPFTRVPLGAVAGMLSGATQHLRMPGVDMSTVGGLDVATNMMLGAGQLISGQQGGALGQLQIQAMMDLRRNPDVMRRLKNLDIDLNTVPGMQRAIARAPELAARGPKEGAPEVIQSIFAMYGRYTSPDLLEMLLGGGEAAHQVATKPQDVLKAFMSRPLAVRGADRQFTAEELERKALGLQAVPGVDQYYQYGIRPQNMALDLARELAGPIGDALTKGMADIRDEVQRTLFTFLNSDSETQNATPLPRPPAALGYAGSDVSLGYGALLP